jgi:hypothetical protein
MPLMNDAVVLSQAASSRRCVWHRPVDEYGDGLVYFLQVELEDDGLVAHGRSALDGPDSLDLPTFLASLVVRWQGWEGTLSWTSMEGEMTLDATHHGRRVRLAVTLRRPDRTYAPDAWSARVVFTLEPGEQLRNLATDAADVLTRH